MTHRFTADCENPFCVFIAEGIESERSEEAFGIALLLHEEFSKKKFEACCVGGLQEPEITMRHDFPCPCLYSDDDDEEDECYENY